ncbi:MAG: hypothetical protein CMM94_06870 [Rickettsiales bacterium]|nr:hypothetical protein [Rickettsiales bacterium]
MRFYFALCAVLLVFSTPLSGAYAAPKHGITLFGELKYPPYFRHFDYVNPHAPHGGSLRMSYTAAFDSLNPFILKGVPAPGMGKVFESLMVQSLDEPQSFYGLVAESIEVADDNSYVDFIIRDKARWHDGKPITSHDVAFSFNTLKQDGHPSYRIMYAQIDRVEKVGIREVRFYFSDPSNRELATIIAGLPVLPRHYYETHPFNQTTLQPPLGSGPYRVANVDQGRSITFERVEDYWGKQLPVNRGQNNFDIIRYDVFRDETVSVEAIKSGQYDFREEYIARNWATAYNIPAVERGELIKEKIPHKIPRGMQAFIFNTRKDKFSDRRVREAIGMTMDFQWMNRVLFYDAYDRSYSFFQNTDFMATGLPSGAELSLLNQNRDALPEALFTEPFVLPETDGSGYSRDILLEAQALLNDAGWVMQDGKRVNAETGEPLIVEFMMRQRTFQRVVGMMQKNLARLGIDSSFRYVDDSQYQKRIDKRDFDIVSIWWNRGIHFPGNEQISFWHSSQADVVGGQNVAGVKNPVIDDLLAELTASKDYDHLKASATALDRVLLWQHYVIPHWHLSAWRVLHWDKFGMPEVRPAYGLPLDAWWSKEAEQ